MARQPLIVDTNVLVSGLLTSETDSPPAAIVDRMLNGHLWFVLSVELLAEYRDVLLRPRIASRHGLTVDEIDRILFELTRNAVVREIDLSPHALPDPGDAHLWGLMETEPTAILVTGDKALLANPPTGRSVVSPTAALEMTSHGARL